MIIFVLALSIFVPSFASAAPYNIGWYVNGDSNDAAKLSSFASAGATLMNSASSAWYYTGQPYILTNYLNAAQNVGIKVFMSVSSAPLTDSQITGLVNLVKNHPAIAGYYIADEPELGHGTPADIQRIYDLVKAADPNPAHPAMIAFCTISQSGSYMPYLDMVGEDYYPAGTNSALGSFGGQIPGSYDAWKDMLQNAATYGKSSSVAIVQGIDLDGSGNPGGYRDLTDGEYRYHVFSAVVQGVKNILFWADFSDWASPTMIAHGNKMMSQVQAIGAEMNNGTSNSGLAAVSQSATNLAYRYGVNGTSGVILAVNIANRNGGGSTLSNVSFTLPSDVRPTSVTVLDENRTIPVSNGVFTDTFTPFGVHVYKFTISSTTPPSTPPPAIPGDLNADSAVNVTDFNIIKTDFLRLTAALSNPKSDIDADGQATIKDVGILMSAWN